MDNEETVQILISEEETTHCKLCSCFSYNTFQNIYNFCLRFRV